MKKEGLYRVFIKYCVFFPKILKYSAAKNWHSSENSQYLINILYMYLISTMYPISTIPLNLNIRQMPSKYMESWHNSAIIHGFNLFQPVNNQKPCTVPNFDMYPISTNQKTVCSIQRDEQIVKRSKGLL